MRNPLVSIIIPVYNAGEYLAECVESAINQTWADKEIIIVDDGSTDSSLKIARGYEKDWIKIINQPNKGASAARNRGLQEATGAYIQFLDADDILSLDKIAHQVNALNNAPNYLAVCSTVHFNNGDDYQAATPSVYEEKFLIDTDPATFLINLRGGYSGEGSMVQPNAWLVPRNIIDRAGGWDESLSLDDDGEYFCRVILASGGVMKTAGYNYYRKYPLKKSLSTLNGYKTFSSAVRATDLMMKHLNGYLNITEKYNCFYKTYKGLAISCFPEHKHLSKYCWNRANIIRKSAGEKDNIKITLGGRLINFIAKLNWRLARHMQFVLRHFSGLL